MKNCPRYKANSTYQSVTVRGTESRDERSERDERGESRKSRVGDGRESEREEDQRYKLIRRGISAKSRILNT